MTHKKIDHTTNVPVNKVQSGTENEVANKQIDLQDIMTLVEKLGDSGKQTFLQNLSQERNLSENVFNLLLKGADSQVLIHLCADDELSGSLLENVVQKLLGIAKGTEKVPLVYINNRSDDYDDFDDFEQDEPENEAGNERVVNQYMVEDIIVFLDHLFKNKNLTTKHIEDIMESATGSMSWPTMLSLCAHPNVPSWLLEKAYRTNPGNTRDVVLQNPNVSVELKNEIAGIANEKEEKDKVERVIKDIQKKHEALDMHQILQYYENKKDTVTSKTIAEHMYQKDLGNFRYGAKEEYEKLIFKLQLVEKYNLGEGCKLRVLYYMIGDNIVNQGKLQGYANDAYTYLTIPELQEKYAVIIEDEKIKDLCKKILEQALSQYKENTKQIENILKVVNELKIDISNDTRKQYINAIVDGVASHAYSSSFSSDSRDYFQKSLKLLIEYKRLFSEQELQKYIKMIEKAQIEFHKTNVRDIFEVMEKLEMSGNFVHQLALKKFKEVYVHGYNLDKGKEFVKKFAITEEEIIDIIEHSGWDFASLPTTPYSLELSLTTYGINPDKIIPALKPRMKEDIIECIKRKDYLNAQEIITKYNLSNDPDFQEQVEILNTLTQ